MIISFQKCAVGSPEMENEFAKSHVLYQGRIEEKWVFGCSRHWKRKRSLFHSPDSQLTELKRTWAFSFTLNFLTLLSRSSTRPFCPFSSICPPCPFSESLSCSLVSMQYLFIFYLVSPHRLCACVFLPLFICLIFFFSSLCLFSFYLCFRIYLLLQFVSFSVELLQFVSFVRQTIFLPHLTSERRQVDVWI